MLSPREQLEQRKQKQKNLEEGNYTFSPKINSKQSKSYRRASDIREKEAEEEEVRATLTLTLTLTLTNPNPNPNPNPSPYPNPNNPPP